VLRKSDGLQLRVTTAGISEKKKTAQICAAVRLSQPCAAVVPACADIA